MPISESDISILIPTYRYFDKVGRAVESALASGAGEIIVTDDHSRDGTVEFLRRYHDPRLKVVENSINVGLWENHRVALGLATRPWIKFIQADDYLLPGALAAFAEAADNGVSIVWGCPIRKDDETGESDQRHTITSGRRLSGVEVLDICLKAGWVLGTPTHMMLRADAIDRDSAAWATAISADLVVGSIAATRGDVHLLPAGTVIHSTHSRQDTRTQGRASGLRRMVLSAAYLRDRAEPELQRFSSLWAAVNLPMAHRAAISAVLRRQLRFSEALSLLRRYWTIAMTARRVAGGLNLVRTARAYRRSNKRPYELDSL